MRKRKVLSLIIATILMFSLVACGNKEDLPEEDTKAEIKVEDTKEGMLTEITDPVEIVFWHAMSGDNEEALEKLVDNFMVENPNIDVNLQYQGKYRELFEKLMGAAKAKQLPTLTQIYSNRLSWYVDKGLVEDLNTYIENDLVGLSDEELKDYPQMFLDDGIWNGGQYAMPFNKSQMVMYYNRDMFEEAGIEVPTTWEEWREAAEKLTKDTDGDGDPDVYGIVFANNISTDISLWLRQAGGMTMDEEKDELLFDTEESKEAIEFINGLIQDDIARLAGEDKYANVPVSQGRAAMCVASTSAISSIKKDTPQDMDIFAAPLPGHKNNAQVYYGTNIAMYNTGTEEEKLAGWMLMKYLTEPENTAFFAQNTGYLPVRYSAREIEEYKDFLVESPINGVGLESFDEGFQGARMIGSINALDVLGEELDLVFAGEKSVEDALRDAQERGTKALEEARKN